MRSFKLLLCASLACVALEAQAAPPRAASSAARDASASSPGQKDPAAIDALNKMSAYLRTIPAFQITLQTQRDDVDIYGQLITLTGQATYKVRRPDAMAIDLALPSGARKYVYDGKTMTVFDPKTGYYGQVKAPATIRETLQLASNTYGVSLPLSDLFNWTEGDNHASVLTSAHFVDKTQIDGQSVNHYAFRQPGVDWQIWIADGDKPAPVRIALVASDDPAKPEFQADLTWDTAPQFASDAFTFTPPANAKQIPIRPKQ
jgi:hypothetical protein